VRSRRSPVSTMGPWTGHAPPDEGERDRNSSHAWWVSYRGGEDCTHDLSVPNRTRYSCATPRWNVYLFFFGVRIMDIMRPSRSGGRSTTATSASSAANRARISFAFSRLCSLAVMPHLLVGPARYDPFVAAPVAAGGRWWRVIRQRPRDGRSQERPLLCTVRTLDAFYAVNGSRRTCTPDPSGPQPGSSRCPAPDRVHDP
jgi:hypothetical protein